MTAKETIAVLGCGWLGLPLAKSLFAKGYRVKGSTTKAEKLPQLAEAGVDPYLLKFTSNGLTGNLGTFLEGTDILYLNIPPQTKTITRLEFEEILKLLITGINSSGVKKLIFISSTSRYMDRYHFPSYNEKSGTFSGTEAGLRLFMAESVFKGLDVLGVKTTIVRFGGLIGPERHPVFHLSGKSEIANPDGPINLIHQKDCIGIIEKIIELEAFGFDFNAVYPYHPSRREYYTSKAKEMGLPLPLFEEGPSVGKTIEPRIVEVVLGYNFKVRP